MTATAGRAGRRYGRCIQYARESGSATGVPFDSQEQFHKSRSRFKGFSGPIGAGKSQAIAGKPRTLASRRARSQISAVTPPPPSP